MQRRGLSLFGRALSGARRGNRGTAQGPGDEVRGRVDADSEAGLDAEGGHATLWSRLDGRPECSSDQSGTRWNQPKGTRALWWLLPSPIQR